MSIGGASSASRNKSAREVAKSSLLELLQLTLFAFDRSSNYISEVMLSGLSSESIDPTFSTNGVDRILTFKRYETPLTEDFVRKIGLPSLVERLPQMGVIDSVKYIDDFEVLSLVAAPLIIDEDSLPSAFDVRRAQHDRDMAQYPPTS